MGKRPYEEIGGVRIYDNPYVDGVTDTRVFITEPSIKRGVTFDCDMFNVRCKQECVSGGVRHTSKCPYDNYRGLPPRSASSPKIPKGYNGTYAKTSDGGVQLVMVTTEQTISQGIIPKGAKTMAKNNNYNGGGKPFTPTFKKYANMNADEQAAFKQGASMVNNNVKERLGLKKPKNANGNNN